jgi:hypothetical protein
LWPYPYIYGYSFTSIVNNAPVNASEETRMAGCHKKLSIHFRVILIDDPPTHNVKLPFVELDRWREAPKSFSLLLAN